MTRRADQAETIWRSGDRQLVTVARNMTTRYLAIGDRCPDRTAAAALQCASPRARGVRPLDADGVDDHLLLGPRPRVRRGDREVRRPLPCEARRTRAERDRQHAVRHLQHRRRGGVRRLRAVGVQHRPDLQPHPGSGVDRPLADAHHRRLRVARISVQRLRRHHQRLPALRPEQRGRRLQQRGGRDRQRRDAACRIFTRAAGARHDDDPDHHVSGVPPECLHGLPGAVAEADDVPVGARARSHGLQRLRLHHRLVEQAQLLDRRDHRRRLSRRGRGGALDRRRSGSRRCCSG